MPGVSRNVLQAAAKLRWLGGGLPQPVRLCERWEESGSRDYLAAEERGNSNRRQTFKLSGLTAGESVEQRENTYEKHHSHSYATWLADRRVLRTARTGADGRGPWRDSNGTLHTHESDRADTSTGSAECHTDAGNSAAQCGTDAPGDDVAKGEPNHDESEHDYWKCHHRGDAEVRAKRHTAGCQADAPHSPHQRPVAPPDAVLG
jgi:hypothetical protein